MTRGDPRYDPSVSPLPSPKGPKPTDHRHHFRHPIFFPMEEDDVEDLVHGANAVRPEYESALRFHFLISSLT